MKLLIALLILFPSLAHASGLIPAVDTDMGCTAPGQVLQFDGNNIVCTAPQRPLTTVGALPTCNSATAGAMYMVTDALLPTVLGAVVAGGSVSIGVTCNGTSYIVE